MLMLMLMLFLMLMLMLMLLLLHQAGVEESSKSMSRRKETHYAGKYARTIATIKMFTSAISKKKSHPSRISWS